MKKIIVYGPGCTRCKDTEAVVRRAVQETGVQADVLKISEVPDMMRAGVMSTPAVSVDGTIKVAGRIPRLEEVKSWIS